MTQILTLSAVVWLELIRRKDFYVLLVLLATLLASLLSFDIFGLSGVAGYVKDLGLLAVWIMAWILAVNTSVRQLPQEEQRGTLFPLLAKPVSRLSLILGKWLGAWSVSIFALACFYLVLCLGVWLKGGWFQAIPLIQAMLLHAAALAIACALGIALSTRMNRDAALITTYIITGSSFLLLPRIPAMLVGTEGVKSIVLYGVYYLLPHFELFDLRRRLVHDWGSPGWSIIGEISLYAVLMTVVFLASAWLGYRKRRFLRGDIL